MSTDSPTILFVEDSDLDFELAQSAIRRLGRPIFVSRVANGSAFLDYMRSIHECPALIVVDIRLPDANGLEIAQRIRKQGPCHQIPLVVFSTSDCEEDFAEAKRIGASEFASKPFEPTQYVETVKSFVSRWVPASLN
jgi:CheY-like chemotaxis protein